MYKYKVTFLALSESLSFNINSPSREAIEEFIKELIFIVGKVDEETETISIESLQQNTYDFKQKIELLVDKFKDQIPQLNGVLAYFRKLQEGQYFFFLPNIELTQFEKVKLYDYLTATTENINFDEAHKQSKEVFEEFLKKYSVHVYGDNRINIGEANKSKRLCRFCNNTKQPLTFDKTAHAISEALGNKTIRLFDECDLCNEEFSKTFEPDIVQYLSLFRTFFDVKGKGGSKKIKGENFELENKETVELKFWDLGDNPDFSISQKITLETREPISAQNIYKCLCKYFISVVEDKQLKYFSKTIDWLSGKITIEKLPKIAEMISYHGFTKQPKLVVYIRKSEDKELPFAVGEFYFTCKVFAFIIPFTDQDDRDFTDTRDFERYWNTFQHYKRSNGWVFNDYSNDIKKKFIMNLEFKKSDNESDTPKNQSSN